MGNEYLKQLIDNFVVQKGLSSSFEASSATNNESVSIYGDGYNDDVDETNANKLLDNGLEDGNLEYDRWENIEAEKDSFLFIDTGKYTFTTSDGSKIILDDIEGVQVRQNKLTGEIVVIGAKNAIIKGSNEKVKINIYNSSIEKISMGNGDDEIYIEDSVVNEISGGKGNDKIKLSNSEVKTVDGGRGNDEIKISDDSKVDNVKGGKGNDVICVENSSISGTIDAGDNDDYIYSSDSNIFSIKGGKGEDDILIEKSSIDTVDGGKGDDSILVDNSNAIGNIFGGAGNDLINIDNSTVNKVDGGKGTDSIRSRNSDIANFVKDDKDRITNNAVKEVNSLENLDEVSEETAKDITNNKTSAYTNKELTPEEQIQALAIDFFTQNLENMKEQFEAQESEDGAITGAYNWVKQLMDLGISKSDIEYAIKEQEQMISELTAALNGESEMSFDEVFKKWTGKEYSQENMTEYLELSQTYSLAVNGLTKTEIFKNLISNGNSLNEVFEYFTDYYGSEELGREKLNELLNEAFMSNPAEFGYVQSVEINEQNQLVITRPKEYGLNGPLAGTEYETTVEDISEVTNMIKTMPRCFDLDKYTNEFTEKLENTIGCSIVELQEKYKISQLNTFGSGNSFQKLIDKYCDEQEGFADKLASVAQMSGMGLMVIGGVATFVCPPGGMALMTAGKYTALAGMFGDNVLELIDDISSENGLSKEEAWELAKETITEIALLYSGAKINGIASSAKDAVLNATQSKVLAFLAEIGTDASLSLLTDLMITGEIDLTGEGISQLLGIITGIAGAKINKYTKEAFDSADKIFKNTSSDDAYDFLKQKGIRDRDIYNHFKSAELDRVAEYYKQTGNFDGALEIAKSSKILEYNLKNIESEVIDSCKSAEYETVYKMFSENSTIDEIKAFISSSKILDSTDAECILANIETKGLIKTLKSDFGVDLSKYKNIDFSSAQGKLIAEDIELTYKAKMQGIEVSDLMVPTVKDINTGLAKTNVGDVFEVEGNNNIFIKTADGLYKELNMSKEAYCRLFPAVDRYASGQKNSGDCYLVSALNTMLANGATRENLLSCFVENEDGSITVKMPNSDTSIEIKPNQTIEDLGVESDKHVTGALGVQLLEYLYKVDLVQSSLRKNIDVINRYNNKCLESYNAHKDYFNQNGIYDPDMICDFIENENYNILQEIKNKYGLSIEENTANAFWEFMEMDGYLFNADGNLNENGMKYFGLILDTNDTDIINTVVKEYKQKYSEIIDLLVDNKLLKSLQSEKVAAELELENAKDATQAEKAGGNGGRSSEVFEKFGLETQKERGINDHIKFIEELYSNPELQDSYVICAGTILTKEDLKKIYNDKTSSNYQYYHNNPEAYQKALEAAPDSLPFGLVSRHAYSFEVVKNEAGESVIKVTNPWDTATSNKVITLTLDEFKQCFNSLYIAKATN